MSLEGPLIASLRGQFAEFLKDGSLERLRLLASPTCVSFSTDVLIVLACFSRFPFPALQQRIGLALSGTLTSNGGLRFQKTHTRLNLSTRGRNINLLSIDYAFRPRLRFRLTLGGLTFPRKP